MTIKIPERTSEWAYSTESYRQAQQFAANVLNTRMLAASKIFNNAFEIAEPNDAQGLIDLYDEAFPNG